MKKMKSVIAIALALLLFLSLAACQAEPASDTTTNALTFTPAPTIEVVNTPAPEAAPVEETVAQANPIEEFAVSGGVLCLSVNPEIGIVYDDNGNVTALEARNEDAKAIIAKVTDYQGKTAREVITALVSEIGAAGYFIEDVDGEGPRAITIEIEPGSALPSETFIDDVVEGIRICISENAWHRPVDLFGETPYGMTDYVDTDYGPYADGNTDYYGNTDYGPDNDGVTDYTDYGVTGQKPASQTAASPASNKAGYGYTDYNDTDYGPNADGITDYDDTDYGPNADGITDYDDTDYGPNADGVTDYTDYGTAQKPTVTKKPAANHGNTDYGKTDYGKTDYGKSDYGKTDYGKSDYGRSDYGKSDYGRSDYDD